MLYVFYCLVFIGFLLYTTVLPAKSDSYVMFCLQSYCTLRYFLPWSARVDAKRVALYYRLDFIQRFHLAFSQ